MSTRPDERIPGLPHPEADLLERKEWLRVTLSSIGDAVITTDAHGRVTFLNPVAQELTGWTQADAMGEVLENVFRIVNEDSRGTVESPTVRALREGVVVGLANHTLLISKDGAERPIDDSAAPIRDDQGNVAGVVLIFRDISERKAQERVARDALMFAEDIISNLREPLVVLDANLKVKKANEAFYRAFGISREKDEPRQTETTRVIDSLTDGVDVSGMLKKVLDEEEVIADLEVDHEISPLGRRNLLLNARRFVSRDHQPKQILLSLLDITENRRADLAVKESELRYRRLFQTAKDGILILDSASGTIIDANPFMSGLLGYELDEFLGKQLWEIGLFQDQAANKEAYKELRENNYIRYDHLPLRTKDGKEVQVEFVSNLYIVGGHQVAQCNIRDITRRVELENQAREQTEELADLHRRKDEFLAMLSHELRNPLSPILNAVHLLRLQGPENRLQRQARETIERQVGQLARLVNALMEISRINAGRIRLDQELFDMRQVVDRAIESARPLIDRRKHDLVAHLADEPVWLRADPTRLEQVVVNLLTNAAKYTDDGGLIQLDLRQAGKEMTLSIRDNGIGIDAELLPRVFELFSQASRSLDRAQGGLGIGLSLVQRLVELHRGTVEARSAGLDQGSEFIVRLPLESPLSADLPAAAAPETTAVGGLKDRRVLVVDDNIDSAEILAELLRTTGFDVKTAHNGPDALEAAGIYLPDAAILDIGLPGLNGYEVARRFRLDPRLQHAPLIAMTGYGRDADLQLAREAGFDSHLVKPVDFLVLRDLLTNLLESPSGKE